MSEPYHSTKRQALEELLRGLALPAGVAVSGGADSRLLAHTLSRLGIPFTAVHCTGPHLTPQETEHAQRWLAGRGIRHLVIRFNPLTLPQVSANDKDRCYHCKHALFSGIRTLYGTATTIQEGSHASDAQTFRPGMRALAELHIRSPFLEAGLNKEDIRRMAGETGLDWPDQPSRPCLLTRFAYGVQPDAETLHRLGAAEDALSQTGLTGFRLRIPCAGSALLQIPAAQKSLAHAAPDRIQSLLALHGFGNAAIEYAESISGYYDRAFPLDCPLDKHALHE
ncbi:ATP-dependent sacrificial sulfur transferase LarE [Desulfovibrio psychrotolerans]|uniref:Adenine nucleotide alpha hydrolase n=1 Tax=Desulfovibrio psychrotolerans TaxID=415242 RepID=A0A7J0BSQ5_9BACT|nr:ATP-dependent sacrificial sulfur transferase LarE [Desulfovibrio psychrotolerans]GFM36044.1 hypothetical protein DSM19430T_07280 [Desulfovibrio psychrotolerans]